MFNSYVSKHGFTVIGARPMFEEFDEEDLGAAIKAKIFEVFGFYPILDVSEKWEIEPDDYEDGPTALRDFHILIDSDKVDLVGYGISYVQFLFERVIKDRIAKPDALHVNTYASKKYCFSDTEDWWDAMKVDAVPEGRQRIELIVELG